MGIAIPLLYGVHLAWRPGRRARHVHSALRDDWFDAVSAQTGTEVLAVQTLRNSVMGLFSADTYNGCTYNKELSSGTTANSPHSTVDWRCPRSVTRLETS